MVWLARVLAFLIGVAGWFYLFYSRAALRLKGLENPIVNLRRIRLRRVAGVALLCLAGLLYAGFDRLGSPQTIGGFLGIWLSVLVLLLLVLILALIDLRYTMRFYHEQRKHLPEKDQKYK